MIYEISESGPWFDLNEIAAIVPTIDRELITVTLKSGVECICAVSDDDCDRLISAWIDHHRRLATADSDTRRAL